MEEFSKEMLHDIIDAYRLVLIFEHKTCDVYETEGIKESKKELIEDGRSSKKI